MFWYLLNILLITIVWFLPIKEKLVVAGGEIIQSDTKKERRKRLCLVGTINWIILSGLRHVSIGPDTLAYKNSFDEMFNTSWNVIFSNFYDLYVLGANIKDPGYDVIEKIIYTLSGGEYQILLIFIAVLFFICMGVFIYKFSKNPYLSFVLFSCLFYSFFAETGHRQTIATALVVFVGIYLIKKRKLLSFLILVLVSSTIHKSALCFLPFYFVSRIKINKITLSLYWVLIALAFIFRNQLLNFLQSIIGYEQYGQLEGAGAGMFMYLLLTFGIVITIFYKKIIDGNEMTRISFNAILCSCLFSSLLLINQSMMRVVQYYSIFLLNMIPHLGVIFVDKKSLALYNICCIILMVGLLVLNNPVYKFCF